MAKRRPTSKRGNFPQVAVAQTEVGPQFLFRIFVTVLLLSVYGFYLAHQFNLTVGDLGRHLKNGQLFLETGSIPKINLYSYAYPDYPFINHHWGTGVVFYVIERLVGFSGLSVAFIGISMVTFLIFINLAAKYSSFAIAGPIAVVVLPILITRDEVRPELFSYLLAGMFLQVLWGYKYGKLGFRWLLCLPIFEIFWVNLHIYFFIGIFLVAAYLFESLVVFLFGKNQQNVRDQVKALAVILLLTIFAACLNPAGISGAIYPFLILNEYGVPVIENYSVAGILRAGYNFLPLIYFVIILVLVSVSWVYALVRNRSSLSLGNFLSSAFFFAMAWSAIRNFAFFAYFALPLAAVNLKNVLGEENKSRSPSILRISAALAGIAFFLIIINPAYFVSSNRGRVGIGLEEANDAAAEFLLKEKIQGPIFNNFDVAGYLVYHLYPDQRVFVDNRPEAYPVDFFTDVYFPMQSDEEKWAAISQHYGFNVIVFNYRERSVRGEQFIIRRVLDPLWAPVYFDKNIIILAKRDGPNQPVVTKYELPKDRVLERSNG